MSERRSRNLIVAALIVAVYFVGLANVARAAPTGLLSPTDTCSSAVDPSECYQLYIADRLYERHAVDVGAASFVESAGPASIVLLAAAVTIGLVRGARLR